MKDQKEKKDTEIKHKRALTGVVVSDKMKNTVVVEVNRLVKHPKYQKYFRVTKRYKADDPGNIKKIGDKIEMEECRPISKDKHFKII
ncbi:MAG: 30S ribosomal protein S17 [Parcubacteria group bacterium GW2011_GWB1_44_7]|nr:MAG: 30S ribosomal protein S17 [Parcubacteria group bacterium GW2011_GWB1_44_7]